MADSKKPTSIFRPYDEILNLIIPILVLAFVAYELFVHRTFDVYGSSIGALGVNIIIDILLLNITHNAFTIMMFLSLPEMKLWLDTKRGGARYFILRTFALLVFLIFIFGFGFRFGKDVPYFNDLLLLAGVYFPTHHALAQSLGLSILYNQKARAIGPTPMKWVEKLERVLILLLVPITIFFILAGQDTNVLGISLSEMNPRSGLYLGVTVACLILICASLQPKSTRIKKLLFSTRFMVWALTVVSPLAVLATRAIHGLEYLFVVRKMSSNSQKPTWPILAFNVLALTAVFAFVRIYYFMLRQKHQFNSLTEFNILTGITAISVAFTYVHYYLDRQLFLMRRPENREIIGRLLS